MATKPNNPPGNGDPPPSADAPQSGPRPEEPSFEEALEQVEQIIERIESGRSGLEASIREYERGARLLKTCRSILDRAERRIEELNSELLDEPDSSSGGGAPSDEQGEPQPSDPPTRGQPSDPPEPQG